MAEFIDIHIKHGDEVYATDDHGRPVTVGRWIRVSESTYLHDGHEILRIQHGEIDKL